MQAAGCSPLSASLPPPLALTLNATAGARAGGWLFDPLRLSADPSRFERVRVAEIKHGRLAMVAWVGFAAQAAATREGPVQNLVEAWQSGGWGTGLRG